MDNGNDNPVETPFLVLNKAVVRRAGRDILSVDGFVVDEGQSIAILWPNG
ncbi:MAG: hypothetical protein LUB61_06650 [Eggerthellaceae bacterium]|nr:hypothetical protein [Eggerthellaceae bacterium]